MAELPEITDELVATFCRTYENAVGVDGLGHEAAIRAGLAVVLPYVTRRQPEIEAEAVHGWFGLTYANYQVLPRTLLQSMPDEWQTRFVRCLEEMREAFWHIEQADGYIVKPAAEREVGDLSDAELAAVGYSKSDDACTCYATADSATGTITRIPPICPHEPAYYDDQGNEVRLDHRVMVPIGDDPVPHYNRGRTYIAPGDPKQEEADHG